MEERNITITLEEARKWYCGNNEALKELALQAFNEHELVQDFMYIKTLEHACIYLNIDYNFVKNQSDRIAEISKASAAMFKLNIIRKALNLNQDLHLTKDSCICYPYNPFVTRSSTYYGSKINSGKMVVIGKIKSEGKEYSILGGSADYGNLVGLSNFSSDNGVGHAFTATGFLGCANKEIAEHLGRYFGMLITEAKYGDLPDFEIVERRYDNY